MHFHDLDRDEQSGILAGLTDAEAGRIRSLEDIETDLSRAGDVDVVEAIPPYRQPTAPPTLKTRHYKPGTRQLETKKASTTRQRAWWESDDPAVWAQNTERLRAKGGNKADATNIIGWRETGLSGGAH